MKHQKEVKKMALEEIVETLWNTMKVPLKVAEAIFKK